MYADDVKMYTDLSDAEDATSFQEELDALSKWSKIWQLNISSSKCAIMHVRGSETEPEFYINGCAVRIVNEYKDLGVTVDNKLKFTCHINRIVANANSRAILIHKCFVSRDVPTLVRAFTT